MASCGRELPRRPRHGRFGQPYAVHPEQGHELSGSTDYVGVGLSVGTNGVGVFEHGDSRIYSPLVYSADLSGWHHYAIVYSNSTPALYIDGVAVATGLKGSSVPIPSTALVRLSSSAQGYGNFSGSIAEFRVWNYPRTATAIQANFNASLTGTEAGLVGLWKFSESSGASVADASASGNEGSLVGAPTWVTSGLTVDPSAAFAVVAENDNASLGGLPVGLHVISLTNTLARGALVVIESDNVLDERVTLRHSADFGGQPENFAFEWYYQVDGASADPNQPAFDPTQLPLVNEAGDITDARNWIAFPVEPASRHWGKRHHHRHRSTIEPAHALRYLVRDALRHARCPGPSALEWLDRGSRRDAAGASSDVCAGVGQAGDLRHQPVRAAQQRLRKLRPQHPGQRAGQRGSAVPRRRGAESERARQFRAHRDLHDGSQPCPQPEY